MSKTTTNRQWRIAGRPVKRAVAPEDFSWAEVPLEDSGLAPGEVRVRVSHISLNPGLKGQLESIAGYVTGLQTGDVVPSQGLGEVVASAAEERPVGSLVIGNFGWQEYATAPAAETDLASNLKQPTALLGVLGATGLTAYFGLTDIGRPSPGETVVVSGAAGATGSVAGQIARIAGCRVIGIAGGADKCRWITEELGFDAAIDYKSESVRKRLAELAPAGVDVFFDNVGGQILDEVLSRIAPKARVVICGGISQYQREGRNQGPSNYMNLVFRRARMEGFYCGDYADRFDQARGRLAGWLEDGRLKHREYVENGLENAPAAFIGMLAGANVGKTLLKI
jgi:NADPH-dependent curcumin reductase CurA